MDQSAIYGGSHGGGESLPRTALGGTRGQTVKEFDEQAVGVTNEINFNQVVPDGGPELLPNDLDAVLTTSTTLPS